MPELKPCPLCEGEAHYHLCGGVAAHGCGEWVGEVECMRCGLLLDVGPYETKEQAELAAYNKWNHRPRELRYEW